MSVYLRNGDTFSVHSSATISTTDVLPAGLYNLNEAMPNGPLILTKIEHFSLPRKLYGDTEQRSTKILSTFKSRSGNTGVLMIGEKGCGKTLLAQTVAVRGAEIEQYPTLIISAQFMDHRFVNLMNNIHQPCIMMFDEFEKLYDAEKQKNLLTMMEGSNIHNKLFLLTANDGYQINEYLINRPGRVYYCFRYAGLDSNFIKEYCEDVLHRSDHDASLHHRTVMDIIALSQTFDHFSFDNLKCLVEELNRYGESPKEAVKSLNISPFKHESASTYSVHVLKDGKELGSDWTIEPKEIRFNPLQRDVDIELMHKIEPNVDLEVGSGNFVSGNIQDGLTFEDQNYQVMLRKVEKKNFMSRLWIDD